MATLSATLFRQTLDAPLSLQIIAVVVLALALLSLVGGVILLVRIIAPRKGARARVSLAIVRAWPQTADEPLEVFQLRHLEGLIQVLEQARKTGERLSEELRTARLAVTAGIALTAADAILVAMFTVGLL